MNDVLGTNSATQAADTPLPVRFTNVDQILVAAEAEDRIPETIRQITQVLQERHRIKAGQPDDFSIRDMTELSKTLGSTSAMMMRTLFFLPSIIPSVAFMFMWQGFVDPTSGWLNRMILNPLGLGSLNIFYGYNSGNSLFILSSLWTIGPGMLILMGAMQAIPQEIYEAAHVDGAGVIRRQLIEQFGFNAARKAHGPEPPPLVSAGVPRAPVVVKEDAGETPALPGEGREGEGPPCVPSHMNESVSS